MPPQTKNQKKERAAAVQQAQQDFGTVPHSFVFHRGRVGKNVRQLILDVRKVMEPYTARALKVSTGDGSCPGYRAYREPPGGGFQGFAPFPRCRCGKKTR